MADGVKKSRIVSEDDNLEESLMEEFNLRLKNCMSQDKLETLSSHENANKELDEDDGGDDDDDEVDNAETRIYENVETIKRNGDLTKNNINNDHQQQPPQYRIEKASSNGVDVALFLQNERENHYETIGDDGIVDGADTKRSPTNEQLITTDLDVPDVRGNDGEEPKTAVEEEWAHEEENIYENIKEARVDVAETANAVTINEPSDSIDNDDDVQRLFGTVVTSGDEAAKSVKSRMFLTTDDTSCLLFTQTVTSPMLTPSEENIDFLKAFKCQSDQNTLSDGTSNSPKSDDVVDEVVDELAMDPSNKSDPVYCNVMHDDEAKEVEESIYENVDDCRVVPDVVASHYDVPPNNRQNELALKSINGDAEEEEAVYETIDDDRYDAASTNIGEEPKAAVDEPEIVGCTTKTQSTAVGDDRCGEVVYEEIADSQEVEVKRTVDDVCEGSNGLNGEEIDANFTSATTITNNCDQLIETVETQTTYETTIEDQSGQERSIKKKKTKKSRSHEKENISVSDAPTNKCMRLDDCNYNVNVKNLCRSFGDLTRLDEKQLNARMITNSQLKAKTKSMCDVRNSDEKPKAFRSIENVFDGVSVRLLKSSFSKFDALQKKNNNVLHVRSNDSTKAHDKFNGAQQQQQQQQDQEMNNCKACQRPVFQMEQIKAERSIWHKNCFRCRECGKQLNVDTYQSHEGTVYCKPHFKSLFAPKVIEDHEDEEETKTNKYEIIIRENQPQELPPDVVRASDKPDLGLEELQSLNVKERFQVFENYQDDKARSLQSPPSPVNVKKSQTILYKLAKFQAKGMDVGVTDESLNGIPIEASSDEEEEPDDDELDGEDADLVRAKRVQKEKPFHFTQMNDVKSKWENVDQQSTVKDERREERKQEIQTLRNRIFMGKQGKMKEMYQQAVMESESGAKNRKSVDDDRSEIKDTRSIKERFEKGEVFADDAAGPGSAAKELEHEDMSVFESGISKKSRSIFLELDANAQKTTQASSPPSPVKIGNSNVRKARDAYMNRQQSSEDVVRCDEQTEDVQIQTADISNRFKFFETYREPEKQRKQFRMTPPREGQVKLESPEREIYRDPDVVRSEEYVEDDSIVAKQHQTATKMLNKFRQMEENLNREHQAPAGPKPLKRFTPPPPEPPRAESSGSEGECTDSDESEDGTTNNRSGAYVDEDLIQAQKAARAKQLRAKFERWEANEMKREQEGHESQQHCGNNVSEEEAAAAGTTIESTRVIRQRFESMREQQRTEPNRPRVTVHRFVSDLIATTAVEEICDGCNYKVYPLEKIAVHGHVFHRRCFKCMECNTILRMNSYSYNKGLLYCIPHFKQLFISKGGNYDSAFGFVEQQQQDKEKKDWTSNGNSNGEGDAFDLTTTMA